MAELCSAFEDTLQDNIKLEKHRFELLAIYRHDGDLNPHKTNNFSGPPRPELEEAWDRLMKNADIKVSHAELGEFAGDDSVIKLSDGSGYYVTVSAFHGLHCVKRLHMYIYAEHYYAGLSDDANPVASDDGNHQCADWSQVEEWMAERSFDPFEPGLLVHPIFGKGPPSIFRHY
ncbi:hypothetical protein AnigIFM50267_002859 [Aspergillus niger]|nr:hypothetical protein AnigIFM50267_002859 [Aspergillus niger]